MSTPDSPDQRARPLLQHSHSHYFPRSPTAERPPLVHRNTSFSRRHASFDSPREVPLPYMPSEVSKVPYSPDSFITQQDGDAVPTTPSEAASTFADHHSTASGPIAGPSCSVDQRTALASTPHYMDTSADAPLPPSSSPVHSTSPERHQHHQHRRAVAGPVQMYGRPYSAPDPSGGQIYAPRPVRATPPAQADMGDRTSTLSLPLPMNTPYHTLPMVQDPSSSGTAIPEGEVAQAPKVPSGGSPSGSYPVTSSARPRPQYMARENVSPRPAIPSCQPDWLREYSEPRRVMSPGMSGMPQPPMVLTPPPPPQHNAPHEPFLSHAPPPSDSYIAVETSQGEYRLIVRLPGYRRDSITLSSRRRRILHIVADSWEPGGGHFERRISFGYDADLALVRAEFDGEMLRVIVPRRMAIMTYWGT